MMKVSYYSLGQRRAWAVLTISMICVSFSRERLAAFLDTDQVATQETQETLEHLVFLNWAEIKTSLPEHASVEFGPGYR